MSIHKLGYGGCHNPPCRQRPDALEAVFTRAGSVQPIQRFIRALLTSFNFHDFEDCRTRVSVPASPQKLSGLYVTPGQTLTDRRFNKTLNQLLPAYFTRPADRSYCDLMPKHGHAQRARDLVQTAIMCLLRFLIISEVCAMGGTNAKHQKWAQANALLGFGGF